MNAPVPVKITCPACAAEIPPAHVNVVRDVFTCAACGEGFSLSAVVGGQSRRTSRPAHSKVEFVADQESLGLIIPPGNNRSLGWFMLFFSGFWNAVAWGIFISVLLKAKSHGFSAFFAAPAFVLVPFFLIGALTALLCLYCFKGQFTLALDRRECRAIWSLFRWNYSRVARTDEIAAIEEDVIYTQNHRPVYGLVIRHGKDGAKTIKFGAGLKDDERAWLIGELRHFVQAAGHAQT